MDLCIAIAPVTSFLLMDNYIPALEILQSVKRLVGNFFLLKLTILQDSGIWRPICNWKHNPNLYDYGIKDVF